ncbi:HEAT repeat domain-containing protein [Mucilaginibacter sp. HMF5004]|uniref:M1 family aminopeptidase n=1 Tax=Mucilaginibacter rivuli TaxID=2857527 RepID=UPI001C5E2705|nr:M1 family aminopeptidase [Mucilaginibacter rivuli]MBW4891218.1 HEAT repeat domain-containing protein [Mucilaginibacter rivuli]
MSKLKSISLLSTVVVMASTAVLAQQTKPADDPQLKIYRATATKVNDLVHTKLDVRFDYKKCYMYGKEWVTLKPHAYATDSLRLDAKGMDIKNISVVKAGKNYPLKFTYDSLTLAITLDKKYQPNENYTLYIDYTSKPNQLKTTGSAAINDAKGLYFINPEGKDKDKPTQIWTQGESESSSAWFPTIDKPNQKTTDEISMTVPAKYVTLSNGRLVSQKPNADGTRTDTWKMDLPHAPYLFMMAVGDFKIYKDQWRGKEVSYYLEPKYAPYAKDIFGYTPEVMEFYSKTLGVDYPWNKYAQIVVRDYVSGAMENTTATLHGVQVQATKRELIDGRPESETDIVHELFHQWFGDYVTAESWSNITVNESFADFSEALWMEHKHGQDAGDAHAYDNMTRYLGDPKQKTKNLVRFYYADKEDVFDLVSYQKGGQILNMMRKYLGDAVFFKGLNIYLKQNAFGNGEAQQLRLALEQASGKDLNWFFNQWYYRAGHPELDIKYKWDEAAHTQTVYVSQTQAGDAFVLPFAIDVYSGGKKERHNVWMNDKSATYTFNAATRPDLVNVDGDKILLAQKADHKTMEEFAFQYANAPLFVDRSEAIDTATQTQSNPVAQKIMLAALKDKYFELRINAIKQIDLENPAIRAAALPILLNIANTDEKTLVKASALKAIANLKDPGNLALLKQTINSQSYAVQAASLNGIALLEPDNGMKLAKNLEKDSYPPLTGAIAGIYAKSGSDAEFPYVFKAFKNGDTNERFLMMRSYTAMLAKANNTEAVKESLEIFKDFAAKYKSYGVVPFFKQQLGILKTAKDNAAANASGDAKTQLEIQSKATADALAEINKI